MLASAGTTRAAFDPDAASASPSTASPLFRAGALGEDRSLVDLSARDVDVDVDLAAGEASATIWTNDLTYDYVKENAEYSS